MATPLCSYQNTECVLCTQLLGILCVPSVSPGYATALLWWCFRSYYVQLGVLHFSWMPWDHCENAALVWQGFYLLLALHVKIGTRFSLPDKWLFEVSRVKIMRVDCMFSWRNKKNIFLISPLILSYALTHFRLNKLPYNIYWKSPMSILGMSGCVI